ncbi:uncharacterized protein [Haliotis asinina]|uniref:uncharacterized protein n=1 Tax=Haliotis asinina TaxID=109174 RepID=UPI0035325D38
MKVIFLWLCLLLANTGTAQVCQNVSGPTVGPNDPRLPKALPPSFQVTIEGALIEKSSSVVAEEYFDLASQRSAMKITQDGQVEWIYINMNTNESYHISNNNCTVHNQALDSDDAFIGGRMSSSKMPHTYSTSSVLKFAQKYGEVYKGQTRIRGVLCDHWQSCMYWSSLGVNFTVDYYFSAISWTSADNTNQIPVRAEVQGYSSLLGPGPGSSFHHIYDYIGFKSPVVDPTNLETQKGIACPGRKHTRAMPKLKQHYQYREEIVDQDLERIVNADVWYDYNYKLLRFDLRPTALTYPFYSYDAVTEIHDYNTGVAYIIDKSFLNCTMVPIENGTWDATTNVSRAHQALGMKGPEQLFDFTPSFAYSGQRTVRGITCDVFTNVRTDFGDYGLMGMTVTLEVYFMANNWTSDNTVGNNQDSVDTPVRLEISAQGFFASYDFYNFDQENPVLSRFDISKCYLDQDKINFEITFPGDYNDFLLNYPSILEELAVVVLAQTGGLSPIRIQSLSVHWDMKNAYLVGTILDKAPDLVRYRRWPNQVANFKDDATVPNVGDPVNCSIVCNNQQATCNSFDVCPARKTCALSLNYTSDGKVLQSSDTCDHYSRVLTGAVDHETPLAMAYNLIATAVTGGKFVIPVQLPSVGINKKFTATSIRQISYSATTPGATQSSTPGQQTSNPGQQTSKPNPGQQTCKPNPGQQTSTPNPSQQTPKPNPGQQTSTPNPSQQTPKPNPGQQTSTPNPSQQTPKPNPGQQTTKPNPGQQTTKSNPGQQMSTPNPSQQTPKPNPGQQTSTPNPSQQTPKPNPDQQTSTPNPVQQTSTPNPGQQTPKPNPGQQTPKPNPSQQTSTTNKPKPGQQTPKPNLGQQTPKQGTGNNPTKAPVSCGDVASPQKSSSDAGTIAGVAIGMFALGVITCIGVTIFIQRRRPKLESLQVSFANKSYEE